MNDRKSQLLKEKALTNIHLNHNNMQLRLNHLSDQEQEVENQFKNEIQNFTQGIEEAIVQYQNSMKQLSDHSQENESTEGKKQKFNFLKISAIKKYLNTEKGTLKEILEKAQAGTIKSEEDPIHSLMRRNNLNRILRDMQKKYLQYEIKYLSEHVLTESGVIYIPSVGQGQDEELLNEKVKTLVEEVERLTQLEAVCQSVRHVNEEDPCEIALKGLKQQTKRLENLDKMLQEEREEVVHFQKWVNNFDSFANNLPTPKISSNFRHLPKDLGIDLQSLQQSQLDLINTTLRLPSGNIIGSRSCDHDQINKQLKKLMLKANRIK